jgi:Zn-dependent peptidase ImmA (M78 family)
MAVNPFNGSNNDIEVIAQSLLTKFRDLIPTSDSKSDFLRQAISFIGGSIEVIDDPSIYEEEGGSLVIFPSNQFVIRLSPNTSLLRDNFTIAHELGHFVLHHDHNTIPDQEIVFNRYGSGLVEWQANRFAAAFLMPQNEFLEARKKYNDNVIYIAAEFEVSQIAAEKRMEYIC